MLLAQPGWEVVVDNRRIFGPWVLAMPLAWLGGFLLYTALELAAPGTLAAIVAGFGTAALVAAYMAARRAS